MDASTSSWLPIASVPSVRVGPGLARSAATKSAFPPAVLDAQETHLDRLDSVAGFQAMHARGDLALGTDPDDLALATLAALQGGLLLTQLQRDTRPLEVTLDAMLDRIETLTAHGV
jgi:hypothetical protein